MAAKEISDLIDRGRKILDLQKRLIDKKNEIKNSLDNEIEEIRKHSSDCNIFRGVGAGLTTVGVTGVLAIANPVSIAIGISSLVAGKLISFGTDCADEMRSKSFIKKAMDTVASQESLVENLRKELDDFQETIRKKETLKEAGLKLNKRFGGQLSSLVQSNSDICGSPPTDINWSGLCNNFIDKFKDVKDVVDIQSLRTSSDTIDNIIKVVSLVKFIIKEIREIGNLIMSWKSTHPTEEVILGIRGRLVKSIKTLELLSEDLEKNVSKPSKAF